MTERSGLRERKNLRTREAIERAAYELTLEQGYERTTVAEIAERADVAPRTVFTRYPTKDTIIFGRSDASAARLTVAITTHDGALVDRLAVFIRDSIDAYQNALELEKLRVRAILSDPFLRRTLRGQLEAAEDTIAQQLATELGVPPTSAGVRVFAAGVSGLFMAMLDSCIQDPDHHDSLAIIEAGLPVLRAALDALRTEA
jgi:AcrR family transcriptional regulator